jgi:hypothetical protein
MYEYMRSGVLYEHYLGRTEVMIRNLNQDRFEPDTVQMKLHRITACGNLLGLDLCKAETL